MGKRVRRGRFLSDFSPQRSGAAAAGASPPKDDGRGDKYRGVGSDCHADNNGKGKVTQHRAPKKNRQRIGMSVTVLVRIVRLSVWLMLSFMICSIVPRRPLARPSRIRS